MTTKKRAPEAKAGGASRTSKGEQAARPRKAPPAPRHTEAYEQALREFGVAIEMLRAGSWAKAAERFEAIRAANAAEPELAERARTYAAICARKLAPADREPQTPDEFYHFGVVRSNEGRLDEAVRLLDRAVQAKPESASYLYARAAARALQGNAEAAASDLRQAILADPLSRHQAANDPDFEKIRDEAVFIDVMEPSSDER